MVRSRINVPVDERVAFTVQEAADILGISRWVVFKLLREGTLTRYKFGGCVRLNRNEVLGLIGGGDPRGDAA